jgi:hypothetical protein
MVKHYKFGVILMREGQELENDMYSNAEPLPAAYEQFLEMLGERVPLKGHKGYRAGLDVKSDSTGTHSIYTTYRDFEIMFHVSTMLPLDSLDMQQLHRKRHIGNDIVVVVFNAGTTPFNPAAIRSNFNHVFRRRAVRCEHDAAALQGRGRRQGADEQVWPIAAAARHFRRRYGRPARVAAHQADQWRARVVQRAGVQAQDCAHASRAASGRHRQAQMKRFFCKEKDAFAFNPLFSSTSRDTWRRHSSTAPYHPPMGICSRM